MEGEGTDGGSRRVSKTTQKKKRKKGSSTPKTVEEITAAFDKFAGIDVEPTRKAVRAVLQETFGDDFCNKDIKTGLDLLENPPIDIEEEAKRLADAISIDELEFNTITGVQTFGKSKKKEFADVTKEIATLALALHRADLKLAREEKKEDKEPENLVYTIGKAKEVNYVHPAQHFDRETGEAWFGFQLPLSATDAAGKTTTKDVHMLVTLSKPPIPCIPKFLKMSGKKLLVIPYSAGKFGNRISNECLNAISSELSEHTEHTLTPYTLFLKNKKTWKELIWFRDDRWYDFLVLWTFGTYLHRLFAVYAYLFLNGPKGSGKSRVAEIISLTAFNGELSPNLSPSSLFRTVESCCSTLCLDEMEMLGTKKELFHELRSMLLHGYKAGGVVKRTEPGKDGELRQVRFSVYSPKLIGNIEGLDDVLEDRCIPIMMQRLSGSKLRPELKAIVNRIVRTKKRLETFQKLRDSYYMLAYKHWPRIDTLYREAEEAEDESKIVARHLELWFAILTLARFFDEDEGLSGIEDKMRGLIADSIETYQQQEADSNEHTFISTLWSLVKDKTKEEHPWLSYKEIRQAWANHLKGWPGEEMEKRPQPDIPDWMTPRYTGKMFRRKLNFTNKQLKRTGKGGGWHAELTKDHIQELIEYFDVDIEGQDETEHESQRGGFQGRLEEVEREKEGQKHELEGKRGSDKTNKIDPPPSKMSSVSSESSEIDLTNRELRFLREHTVGSGFEPAVDDMDIVGGLVAKGCLSDEEKTGTYRITELGEAALREVGS